MNLAPGCPCWHQLVAWVISSLQLCWIRWGKTMNGLLYSTSTYSCFSFYFSVVSSTENDTCQCCAMPIQLCYKFRAKHFSKITVKSYFSKRNCRLINNWRSQTNEPLCSFCLLLKPYSAYSSLFCSTCNDSQIHLLRPNLESSSAAANQWK